MTVEERLKLIIGDLVISRCALETRLEELEAKIKAREADDNAKVAHPMMFKQAAE